MVKEISAPDLEAACRKCVRITVSDTRPLVHVLDEMNLEFNILSDTQADIYGSVAVTPLTLALAKVGCDILSMQEHDESLESYYISLLGGASHE